MEKIALGQINIEYGNYDKNVAIALDIIQSAVNSGCGLILLPELWSSGFSYSNLHIFAKKNLELVTNLQELADNNNIAIAGSLIQQTTEGFFNTFQLIQPHTDVVSYKKNHLFSLMKEDQYLTAGKGASVFRSPLGVTGAGICFDLRFPDHFSKMSDTGSEIFLLPAHWPLLRIDHWDVLLRARAIENQAYMIATNSTGVSNGQVFGGHSAVIAPDGEVLLQAPHDNAGLYTISIDLEMVSEIRRSFPLGKNKISG